MCVLCGCICVFRNGNKEKQTIHLPYKYVCTILVEIIK